jgi:autotransporter-associated beta strand protein
MKKILLFLIILVGPVGYSQTTFDWMDTAPDGNWRQGASGARWFGGSCGGGCFDEPGFGILRFNNNHQLTMTNNVPGTYNIHQIIFGSVNTSNRTIGNSGSNIVRFFDSSGADPKIENQSTGSHTISFNILGDGDAADPLEINPVSGNLTFNNTVGNQGSPIDIYGNNGFTVRFNNIISGAGAFRIRQNSKVIFNDINVYTGNTELDNGELWIETTGNAVANNNIFIGNGSQLTNFAKIFLSRADGGTTFSRTININPGNANTRFIGSLNTSGTNTFSGSIVRSASGRPLNIEVVNAGGTLAITGVINGSDNITKVGPGTLQLGTNSSTMTGTWLVENGTLLTDNFPARIGGARPITLGTASTSGTLRFTGASATTTTATLAVNAGGGSIFNASTTNFSFSNSFAPGGTLTAGAESTGTLRFTGIISGSNGVIIAGTGKVAYESAAKTYTGTTRLNSGTLEPTATNFIADTSNFIFNGGTYSTGITTGFSETVGTLQLLENSTIRLGDGGNAHTLTFAASNAVSWTSGRTLTITNWSGTPGVAGTAAAGRIFVGSANTTLTTTQLDQITFQGYEPGAVLKSTGELMPKGYITYYSKGSFAPQVLTNWSLTTDGTGASPANFTSTARFVIQNGHTMTTGAAWTLSGANTTLQILNGGALVSTFAVTMPATGIFQIDNGGLYKHDNASAWATTIFTGTEVFGNSSTVEINETAATLPQNSTYGNLTFDLNTPSTPAGSVNFSGNLTTINGNFIIKNTQGFELRLANSGTTLTITGNLEVQANAIFTLKAGTNAGSQTVNVDGNVSLIGGTFYLNGPNSTTGGSAFLVARGASFTISENVTFTGGNLVGASGFYFNRNIEQTLNVAHPFSTGTVRNRFFVSTANSIAINEVYNGVAAQTTIDGTGAAPGTGWAAWPTSGTALKSFTINNSTGVSLSTNRVVNTTLGLTNGTITPGANTLTLAATATFTGGSASSHVNGVLNRVYTATGSTVFPVGKAGVYRPVTFEYTALTGTSTVSVNQIESALTGTLPADTNLNNARTWDISQTGGSSIGYKVTLDPTGDNVTGTVVMLKRESGSTTSHATTSPNFTNTSAFTTLTGVNNFTLGSTCTVSSNAGTNQTDCLGTVFTLAANEPSFGTGAWTVTGPSTNVSQFSNAASPTATFTPDGGSGVYTLTWTITNGNCSSNSNISVTVNDVSTAAVISGTTSICNGSSTDLNVAITGGASPFTVVYTDGTNNFTVSSYTSGAPISVSPTATTTYSLVSVTSTGGCAGTGNSGSAVVTVNSVSTAAVISGTASICSGSPTNLSVAITGGESPFTVIYTDGTSNFTVNSYISGNPISVSPTATTTYTLVSVTSTGGCAGTGNSGSAVVTLTTTTTTDGGVNWSNGTPTSTKAIVFDGATGTIGADVSGCSLQLTNNATVTVASGFNVTLSGALTVDSGSSFTLENNANLIQAGTTNTNSGSITVKRNSSLIKRLDYTLWSSPVASQNLLSFSPQTITNRFYTYNSATNFYESVTSPSTTNFETAKGYLVRVPNNHPAITPTSWAGQFNGVPNNGNYSLTMQDDVAGQRFNLVGNPYPSPIDALAFIENANNSGSITGTLYFWRKTNGSANPSYCTLTGGGFVTNNDAQTFDPNDVIQTGQAFFVEATGTNDQLLFTNEMRIGNNANQFFRNAQTTTTVERNRVWLNAYNGTGAFSQTMIGYMTNASNGLDTQIDGKYINDGEIALSSLLDATPMAIQGRALPFDAADVVPMRFKATTAGTYTIAIDHTDGLFANGQTVFLRDNVLGVTHNLNDGAYNFAVEAGTFDSRFEVVYQATLGTDTPTLTQNQVVVYATDASSITVTTGTIVMNSIKVFDIRGRLLTESNAINASQATLALPATNQVVLLQITAVTGETITKKFVK